MEGVRSFSGGCRCLYFETTGFISGDTSVTSVKPCKFGLSKDGCHLKFLRTLQSRSSHQSLDQGDVGGVGDV